jgi:hypothetical protein
LSLAARTAQSYFELIEANLQAQVAEQSIKDRRTIVDLVRGRFTRGLTRGLDVRLALTDLANAEAQLAQSRNQVQIDNVHSQGLVTLRNDIDLIPEVAGQVIQLHPDFVTGGFFNHNEVRAKTSAWSNSSNRETNSPGFIPPMLLKSDCRYPPASLSFSIYRWERLELEPFGKAQDRLRSLVLKSALAHSSPERRKPGKAASCVTRARWMKAGVYSMRLPKCWRRTGKKTIALLYF